MRPGLLLLVAARMLVGCGTVVPGAGATDAGGSDACPPIVCPSGFVVFDDGGACDCHAPPKQLQHCCTPAP